MLKETLMKTTTFFAAIILCSGIGFAQIATTNDGEFRASSSGMEILEMWASSSGKGFDLYPTGYSSFQTTPYYDGTELKDPIRISINKVNTAPVKVIYSLYTFKKEFMKAGGAMEKGGDVMPRFDCLYYLYGNYFDYIAESIKNQVNIDKIQADIDKILDKIYEFDPINETSSENYRDLYWDGKTDPNLTGKSLPVRSHLFISAHNALQSVK